MHPRRGEPSPRASSKTTSSSARCTYGAFNVKTGEAVQAPCFTALRTYKVVVQDGQVMVDLDKDAGQIASTRRGLGSWPCYVALLRVGECGWPPASCPWPT